MQIWPNWWGTFGRATFTRNRWPSVHWGSCSHGTAWQFRINFPLGWHYYIVFRKKDWS